MKKVIAKAKAVCASKKVKIAVFLVAAFLLITSFVLALLAFIDTKRDKTEEIVDSLLSEWESALERGDGEELSALEEKMQELHALLLQNDTAKVVYEKIAPSSVSVMAYYEGQSALGYGGSGFFISEDGMIATAYHVVKGANSIRVRTSDRKYHDVVYIAGYDEELDVAILKINRADCVPVSVSTEKEDPGETLYALGRNSGVDFTYTTGILAYTGDVLGSYPKRKLIRYCNLTQKGDSGCAIFNSRGEAIGMCQLQDNTYGTMQWALLIEQVMSVPTDRQLSLTEVAQNEALDLSPYLSYYIDQQGVHIDGLKSSLPTNEYVVKIPATIEGVPVYSVSFAGEAMPNVRQILLPEGIVRLGTAFLSENSKIASVHIPSSVTEIWTDAFYGATALTSVTSDSAILQITEDRVLSADGTVLYRVLKTPEDGILSLAGVLHVADYAVYGRSVTTVNDTEQILHIGAYAFARTSLTAFCADGARLIDTRAFYGCDALSSLSLSPSLVRIEDEAFYGCRSLENVTLNEGVLYLGKGAFAQTALSDISLPESLLYLSADTFADTRLSKVSFASLPYLEALSAFGTTSDISKITFLLPDALYTAAQNDPLYKTLFAIGKVQNEKQSAR